MAEIIATQVMIILRLSPLLTLDETDSHGRVGRTAPYVELGTTQHTATATPPHGGLALNPKALEKRRKRIRNGEYYRLSMSLPQQQQQQQQEEVVSGE